MRLKQGDKVMVITGKDAGKESRIKRVFPGNGRILVEGVNTAKRHTKPRGQTLQGGIPTRIGHRIDDKGVKHRTCVKCGGDL
jgi:large subunit ribosomal protein L24